MVIYRSLANITPKEINNTYMWLQTNCTYFYNSQTNCYWHRYLHGEISLTPIRFTGLESKDHRVLASTSLTLAHPSSTTREIGIEVVLNI